MKTAGIWIFVQGKPTCLKTTPSGWIIRGAFVNTLWVARIQTQTIVFISKLCRDDVTEEEYRAANRAAKMKGRCDDEPRKPRARKVKDKTPLWSSESKVLYLVTTTSQGSGTPHTVYYTGSQGLTQNSLNSQPTTNCRSIMNRKKVLLMGKSGSGKTSMR